MRDRQGFDFVGRHFKRLSPTKFLVRSASVLDPGSPGRSCHNCSVTRALPGHGVQIQKANAIIRGFCNHYRADHNYRVFQHPDVLDTAGVL